MIRMFNRNNWFMRLLIPYVLFLLLALSLGWLIYEKTLELVGNEARNSNLHMLEQVKSTLDGRLAEMDTIIMQVANDPKVLRFQQVNEPFEGTNTYKVLATQKDLYNYSVSNKFILNYLIYYRNSDFIIAPSLMYESDKFYRLVLQYEGMDYEQWHAAFFEGNNRKRFLPATNATYLGNPRSIVTYSHPLGNPPGKAQGSIVVLINNNEIMKLIGGLDIKDGGWAYIADEQGNIISSTGTYTKLDPASMSSQSGFIAESRHTEGNMITYTRSTSNGWYYVLAQSPHVVLEKANYVKRITFSMTLVFLVIGIVLAYFFTSRNSRKLSYVLDNNLVLQEEIEKQAPLLRATLIDRLLKGELVAGGEMEKLLKHQQLSTQITFAAAAIVQFAPGDSYEGERLKELDRLRVIIKEMLRNEHAYPIHHDVAEDKIVLLFLENDISTDACMHRMGALFNKITDVFLSQFHLSLNIASGGVYTSMLDVSRSYGEAKHALNYSLRKQLQGIVWFHQLPDLSDSHYYPGEIETRLMNHAKAGDLNEVNLLIDDIYERNFVKRNLVPSIQRLLLYDMAGSLMKLRQQLSLEEEIDVLTLLRNANDSDDLASVFRYIKQLYSNICKVLLERRKSQNVRLLQSIQHSLQTMYINADLNLDTIADQTGISKVYISSFFKEQTGVNFSDYLENLRMDKARVMLSDTGLTVNEIAQQTGYSSTNSFCRAFKRINGISPTAYRSSNPSYP
ncbi:helix-turn-helix domain-containing protein [Paenibacillus sp. PL91]|uniref:helix-turn-helix domain-containing protein n=1 Tax=Paenibacillus sp. PL91 TaxID=2729538 RepID=UPI00145D42E1|nr:helix-turn-helix domain-containing protein [Paenibacillus sp. PL91]MBC9200081.1 helix-turn-helix domain-containing protein [Paenibacillus sp. PL91]